MDSACCQDVALQLPYPVSGGSPGVRHSAVYPAMAGNVVLGGITLFTALANTATKHFFARCAQKKR